MCSVIHFQNDKIPQTLPASDVLAVAIAADMYDCTKALQFASKSWLRELKAKPEDLMLLAAAAYLVRNAQSFREITAALVLNHHGSYVALSGEDTASIMPWEEAIAATSSITSLLDFSLSVIKTLRRASNAFIDAPQIISNVSIQLDDLQEVLEVVQKERELQADSVEAELARLKVTLGQLEAVYSKLDKRANKNGIKQFMHTLWDHDRDVEEIREILGRIGSHQESLTIRILVINAGLVGTLRDGYHLNGATLTRVDQNVAKALGEGVRIRRVLEDRSLLSIEGNEELANSSGADRATIREATANISSEASADMEKYVTRRLKAGDGFIYHEGDLGLDFSNTTKQKSVMEDIELGKESSVTRGNISKDASEAFIAGLWGRRS
ncbi:uncharacterized protein FFB20_10243 [Fusarium fujikuroi]|nr:uncharacterized protein FFE2_06416 [Fusarium fujikuroi]SCN93955.1 uncharacterized protein FFM5_05863 [Fusarium fujikuroi]SCN96777.1 uncharacterized protein FFB20_10243 [Fusarium fujikuroi]SCO31061.1 uncharacterized protein FFNC_01753 [Fusarium fujikuroi]